MSRRAAAALAAVLAFSPAANALERSWSFRVFLDDREIGRHDFVLSERGAERELVSQARFDVTVLFVNVYRYVHRAVERWQGECLVGLEARTETNGTVEQVSAATRNGELVVERAATREAHPGCLMSFAYWNPRILAEKRLLNSQTGEVLSVTVQPRGTEPVKGPAGVIPAMRYHISATNLSIDLWYAGDRWVALEAPARGGSRLRYELL